MIDPPRPPRPAVVSQPVDASLAVAGPQAITIVQVAPTFPAILVLEIPSAARSTIRARCASPAGTEVERTKPGQLFPITFPQWQRGRRTVCHNP